MRRPFEAILAAGTGGRAGSPHGGVERRGVRRRSDASAQDGLTRQRISATFAEFSLRIQAGAAAARGRLAATSGRSEAYIAVIMLAGIAGSAAMLAAQYMVSVPPGVGAGAALQAPPARAAIGALLASILTTLGPAPGVHAVFEHGFTDLRRQAARQTRKRA